MVLRGDEIIEKRNILNEMRQSSMSLQELRFFSIYLSKINAREPSTRKVTFPLADFKKIMELGRINIKHMQAATNSLLGKVVNIRLENGGYEAFQLFKRCKVYKDEYNQWFIDIDAHDDALPLMFEFKNRYFTYGLWNILQLSSAYHVRIYELLKQHQTQNTWTYNLAEFRDLIGVEKNQYPRFGDFKTWVLLPAQKALKEKTDLQFDFELVKKGAKVIAIKFIIEQNTEYIDQLSLDEFIEQQPEVFVADADEEVLNEQRESRDKICSGFSDEIFDEFSDEQLTELRALAWDMVDDDEVEREQHILGSVLVAKEFVVSSYIRRKILMCNAKGNTIKSRYGYIKHAVAEDWQ